MSVSNQDAQTKNISIAELQKILIKEIHSPVLTSFDPDLYKRIAKTISNLKGVGYEGTQAKARDRIVELASLAAISLLENRLRKFATGADSIDYSKLTDEEKYILDSEGESRKRINDIISACNNGRPKVLDSIGEKVRSKRILVRFLRNTEQFIGIDLAKYGPFKEQDVATIPYENARSFVAGKVAVEVDATLIKNQF